jgi:RNA polymerase-interacting CarD/CdnL/TRCF family regulator
VPEEITIGDSSIRIGDRVVYLNRICRVKGVETREIAGRTWEFLTLTREQDDATVMVPREKVAGVGLRKVAGEEEILELFEFLSGRPMNPELDWKVRHRQHAERLAGGGLQGTAETLKSLHALARVRPLPQRERELYDNSRHLLIEEIAAALALPLAAAEDQLDYALQPPPSLERPKAAVDKARRALIAKAAARTAGAKKKAPAKKAAPAKAAARKAPRKPAAKPARPRAKKGKK